MTGVITAGLYPVIRTAPTVTGRPRKLALPPSTIAGWPRQLGLPLPSLGGPVNWHCQYHHANWDCHYHHWAATSTATTIAGRPRRLALPLPSYHRWASPSTGTACHHWAAPSTGTATTITEWPRQLGPPIPPRFLGAATDRVLSLTRIAGPRFLSVFLLAAGPNTSPTDNSCKRSRAFRLSWCRNLLPGSSLRYCNWPTADWLSWSL